MKTRFRFFALVAVLVVAQAAALSHLDTDDSHPAGESCAACVALSSLAAGNVSAPLSFDVVVADLPRDSYLAGLELTLRPSLQLARGPPAAA